jgi:uncharacterized protein YdaU (DUF1376 family)
MHYYQFNIGDYAKSTKHLTLLEDLAYRRLLDIYYDTEKPLNSNVKQLARIAGMSAYTGEITNVLSDFFTETEEGFTQKKAACEIEAYQAKAGTARVNGKLGGRPKKTQPEPKETQSVNSANPDETGLQGNYKPLTINQEPLTNNQELSLKEKALSPKVDVDESFEKVWKQYPSKQNKKKALATFTAYVKKKKLDIKDFADYLIKDICERCNSQQFGFDKLHFTTYMNGERWFDEITQNLSDADAKHEAWKRSIQETDYTDLLGE